MDNRSARNQFELLCVIVNFGLGSKAMKIAKQNGVLGGTIFLGKGTTNSHLLKILDLSDIRKEIVLFLAEKQIINKVLKELNQKYDFKKPNKGIAFTTSVNRIIGAHNCPSEVNESRGEEDNMHNAIFVVVDRGKAEDVLEAAMAAGSRGGTIINARGSGIHENTKLFSMLIEPEKEIVLILTEKEFTEAIASSIRKHLDIDKPGKGIMFILDVNQTYGLY
ncbi:MAG: P-II family nitrogen regulator [Syntrophomonadaceae bacterium]|jgi:nitrogen regulatory protein PII